MAAQSSSSPPEDTHPDREFELHWSLYPKTYVAPYISTPPEINGDINKEEWSRIPWSSTFVDITGDNADGGPGPTNAQRTQMKMAWDDEYLYIAAILYSDFPMVASFTKRNDPIYQKDSDFEVFLDPPQCCHYYKEFEVNPINTVWNLMLDKPYLDNGREHSARIAEEGDDLYYEVGKQKTATKILSGSVNNHDDDENTTNIWAVEIAMSHDDTLAHLSSNKPKVGDRWKINFLRVEKEEKITWSWQPQIVWDPAQRKYVGKINMHLPDAWGYLQFAPAASDPACGLACDGKNSNEKDNSHNSNEVGEVVGVDNNEYRDPSWPAKVAAMNIYYAQQYYKNENPKKKYATSLEELGGFVDINIIRPFIAERNIGGGAIVISLTSSSSQEGDDKVYVENDSKVWVSEEGFVIKVVTPKNGWTVTVSDDRLMRVFPPPRHNGLRSKEEKTLVDE